MLQTKRTSSRGPWLRLSRSVAWVTALAGFYGFVAFFAGFLPGCVRQKCFDNLDCPSPMVCNAAGKCVYQCTKDADCGVGFQCVGYVCKPKPGGNITCPSDMVPVAGLFCIDRYEASRPDATSTYSGSDGSRAQSVPGVMPWEVADNATAQAACEAAGKRLCAPEEWQLACQGPDGTVYSYGDAYEMATCNGIDAFGKWPDVWLFHLMPTGSFPGCTNEWGIFDINGNLWEHTMNGSDMTVRGGAFNCSDSAALHRCEYIPSYWAPSARGFRCCQSPSPEPEETGAAAQAIHLPGESGALLLGPTAP